MRTDIHVHLAPLLDAPGPQVGPPKLYDVAALGSYLSTAELDHAVVSLPPPFYRQHQSLAEARAWVPAVNDGMLARIDGEPSLSALAYLPLEHPALAVEEYARIRTDGRFVGVTASAGGLSTLGSDPALLPLWGALDADGAALLLHPGTSPDPRLDDFYLSNLLGNPSETAVAVAHLALGGVLHDHPRMKVVLVHCGGTVPAVVGRWDRGALTDRPGLDGLAEPPRESVRRLYADCLAHDPAVVDLAVGTFGEDHLLLGSDWPFPMGTDDPVALLRHRGVDFVERAAGANALAVFPGIVRSAARAG